MDYLPLRNAFSSNLIAGAMEEGWGPPEPPYLRGSGSPEDN